MNRNILFFIILLFVSSCAPLSKTPSSQKLLAYTPIKQDTSLLSRFHPIFIIEKPDKPYNRIGTPRAEIQEEGGTRVFVDPKEASVYTEKRTFKTATGTYTNLIYRIHYPCT